MSGQLPSYSHGEYDSASQVSDVKAQPPQYHEASGIAQGSSQASGETYLQKTTAGSINVNRRPTSFTIHTTETDNFVLLDEETAAPSYYIDNTTALSKTFVRRGNSTSGPIISLSKVAGPFVKKMISEYESKTKSGAKETILVGEGKFHVTWSFSIKKSIYDWRSSKGIWILSTDGHEVARYDAERSLHLDTAHADLSDIIVSTIFAISLYARLSSERRRRALNNISGKSSSSMLGSGLLL